MMARVGITRCRICNADVNAELLTIDSVCSNCYGGHTATYGYRLYRAGEFCKLDVGIWQEQAALEVACDEIATGRYDRAEITCNGAIIGTVNNTLEYVKCN